MKEELEQKRFWKNSS